MSEPRSPVVTGGCQCGAIRYALGATPGNPHICHCRMCQKAFGGYSAPLASVSLPEFHVTRGEIAIYRSSDPTERGFCRDCGTPLTFRYIESDRISVALGSLDDPTEIPPVRQFGAEARMPWFGDLAGLPSQSTDELGVERPELFATIRQSGHQHPDHDTDRWPDEEGR